MIDFKKDLAFIKGEVDVSEATKDAYSHDASVFEIRPQVVVFPRDAEDISNLVKWVNDHKKEDPELSITMRAAGTCMSGGSINDSIIVDTTKFMNQIVSIRKSLPFTILPHFYGAKEVVCTGEAIVQPGVMYRDFEKQAQEAGLLLPCYTASKSINALGGMVGNNSGGELTLRYGKMEDYVRELKVILKDGHEYTVRPLTRRELYSKIAQIDFEGELYKTIYNLIKDNEQLIRAAKPRVSKNSSGYNLWNTISKDKENEDVFDMSQLIIGAQGTLGLVTEMKIALVEPRKASALVVIMMNSLDNLGELVHEISKTHPESMESYDDKTFKLAMKFFKDFVKAKGLWGTFKFGTQFIPEFFMMITGGVPKLILLVEYWADNEANAKKRGRELVPLVSKFGHTVRVTEDETEAKKYWDMRRDSFALLRKHVKGKRTAPFIDDIIVRPEFLPEFLPKLYTLFEQYPELVYTIAGHAGNGNFHVIPLMDFNNPKTTETILTLSEKVYELVIKYEGSIDAEHNDGIIRTPFLTQMFGEQIVDLFKSTKQVFDPKNIFNPKKKVGGTKEDIKKYLIKPDHPSQVHSS
jgi:FAD/FMN-containing dehydrogenase